MNYFEGRLLSAEDFRAEHEYRREKSRRHNRRVHGSGVVSGFTVSLTGGDRAGAGDAVVSDPLW